MKVKGKCKRDLYTQQKEDARRSESESEESACLDCKHGLKGTIIDCRYMVNVHGKRISSCLLLSG